MEEGTETGQAEGTRKIEKTKRSLIQEFADHIHGCAGLSPIQGGPFPFTPCPEQIQNGLFV